jgi:hypothetical protein
MTQRQLAAFSAHLLEVSRIYCHQAKPLGDTDNYICNMTTSMVLAGIAHALLEFQKEEIEK